MSKSWNVDQQRAIDVRNKNILVSASAGSGKTGVLIQRLVELVTKDGVQLNEILAMTFTNAAAAEMKKRLSSEITQLIAKSSDEKERNYLNSQLTQLTTAHISTIHSFCLSIIQNYYYIINCSPRRASNILDAATQGLYQQQALEQVFYEETKQCDEAFLKLNLLLSPRPEATDELKTLILKIAALADAQPEPKAWLMKCVQAYENIHSVHDLPKAVFEAFFDYLETQLSAYLDALNEIKAYYEADYADEIKKSTVFFNKVAGIENVKEALCNHDFDRLREAVIAMAKIAIPTTPDKENLRYTALRKQCIEIEDLFAGFYPEKVMVSDTAAMLPLIRKLVDCVLGYMEVYEKIKADHEAIDFSDMEHMALKILHANNGYVASLYREQFKEIMVDEFQDSNDVQDELVLTITRGNNVFRVGDVKQSIYGFRYASPAIMQGYKELNDELNELIVFKKNYRSSETIVRFNNVLYEKLMNVDGFQSLPFLEEDLASIGGPWQQQILKPICFHALNYKDITQDSETAIHKDELKASYIANQILEIKEREGYKYKDFVVLVRGNAKMDLLKKVFDEINLPCTMNSKHGFYESYGIQILLSALSCFINPRDDLNFTAMLTSPFFNFSSEALATLKLARIDHEHFYDTLTRLNPDVLSHFEDIRENHTNSISECINACLNWNDFYQASCTIRDKTNIDLLFDKITSYEKEHGNGISGFLNTIAQIRNLEAAEANSVSKEDDVVRFMSIHQSKGLEFPVVFLWASSTMPSIESRELVNADRELGIGIKTMTFPQRLIRPTFHRLAIDHKKNRSELEEEMRILYVATTRAKDQMHIVDYVKDVNAYMDGLSRSKIYARKGTSSWILQALLEESGIQDLFVLKSVNRPWSNKTQPKPYLQHKEIPVYQQHEKRLDIHSPSQVEGESELKPIHFDQKTRASDTGNIYHKLTELLPNADWTVEMIEETAKMLNCRCTSGIVKNLMALNSNELFRSTFTMEIHHEMPFQVIINHQLMHGYMDYVAIDQQRIILIDFKSDQQLSDHELHQRYDEQLADYVKACQLLYPNHQVDAYLYSFSNQSMTMIEKY